MRTPEEKLFYLARVLSDKFAIAPVNESIVIRYDCLQDVSNLDCYYMLKKFADELNVIKFLEEHEDYARISKTEDFNNHFVLELGRNFKALHEVKQDVNNPILWLSHNNKGQLLLNDVLLLTTTRNNSINNRLLTYLIQNPNITVSRQELENKAVLDKNAGEDKDFYVVLDDIKIKHELRKLFFSTDLSKHTLHLKNPIYEDDLKQHDIDIIDIKKIFK